MYLLTRTSLNFHPVYIYIHSIVIFHICMSLFESTCISLCKPQSKLDLPTLRQSIRERKNATEQIKNMTLYVYIYIHSEKSSVVNPEED